MICNLNQLNFQGFGILLPERAGSRNAAQWGSTAQELSLPSGEVPAYRAKCDTWVTSGSGMTVLSVSHDGQQFRDFYLDKPVCIKEGVVFSLSPFQQSSTARLAADIPPEQLGLRIADQSLPLRRGTEVHSIYTFFYQEKERGFFFPGEAHSMLELTYVDRGSIHSVTDGQELVLRQGQVAIYGPGQWHVQYADIDVAPSFVTITFDILGNNLEALQNQVIHLSQRGVQVLQQLLQERDKTDQYASDMMLCLLQQLLLILLRESNTPQSGPRTAKAVHSENAIIRRAQQYISTHIRERLTVPVVASHVKVSASYLTALFNKNLQISPAEYIRRIKLQESKQMIREGDMNFTEIAAALQYSTVHHFSRQFKEKFGITPTEYAKSIR